MEKFELDLACWRPGETVNSEEQINTDDTMDPSTPNLEVERTVAAPTRVARIPATSMAGLMVPLLPLNMYA